MKRNKATQTFVVINGMAHGKPFITLKYNKGDKWGFSFGYQKAKLLLIAAGEVLSPLTKALSKFINDVDNGTFVGTPVN